MDQLDLFNIETGKTVIPKKWINDVYNTTPLIKGNNIYHQLEQAAKNRQLLVTFRENRKTGKTTTLIKFSRDCGYTILVDNNTIVNIYKDYYGYKNVKSINSNLDGYPFGFVIDDSCNRKKIQQLVDNGHFIITGFIQDSF